MVRKQTQELSTCRSRRLNDGYLERANPRTARFWKPEWGTDPVLIEAFEISEYAGQASEDWLNQLFPGRLPR
jgi:hypothetical protein